MVKLKYKSALVTGGAGFIGSHICEELLRQGRRVVCLDNFVAGKQENIAGFLRNPNFTLVNADITNLPAILPAFDGIDVVFHNAASKCTVCRVDPQRDLMVNAWGTWNVYEASRKAGVKKVVHASTGSVYGEAQYFPQDEKHPYNPVSFYGVSKLAGERYSNAFRDYYGMDISIVRYFHVYGPRQESSDVGGVMPIFIRRAWEGEPLIIFGDGSQLRSFTYVLDDVFANFAIANSERSNGEAYNSASGIRVTIRQLAEKVLRIMNRQDLPIIHKDWRAGDIKVFNVSSDKLKTLGFDFETSFDEGLAATIEWYVRYFEARKQAESVA